MVKGEAIPAHSTKTYGGSGGLTSLILYLYSRCRWSVSLMIRSFYSRGKIPLTRSTGGWGGSHSASKSFLEKHLLALLGTKNVSSVVLTTNLYYRVMPAINLYQDQWEMSSRKKIVLEGGYPYFVTLEKAVTVPPGANSSHVVGSTF